MKFQIYPFLNIKSQKNLYYLNVTFQKQNLKYGNAKLKHGKHLCLTPPQSSVKNPTPLNGEPLLPLSFLKFNVLKNKPKIFRNIQLQQLSLAPPQPSIKNLAHLSPLNDVVVSHCYL